MARQVNTRFVLILGGVLAGLSILVVGVFSLRKIPFFQNLMQHDPHLLINQAEEALKQGDKNTAIGYFNQAVPQALRTHMPQTERLFLRLGDVNYDASTDSDHYRNALDSWQRALLMNPKFKDAQERLLRERYLHATRLSSDWWPTVEKLASALIEMDPSSTEGYVDHAEAVFEAGRER